MNYTGAYGKEVEGSGVLGIKVETAFRRGRGSGEHQGKLANG
jgi:hypothetical protein